MDVTLALNVGLPELIDQLEVSNLHRHRDVSRRQVGIGWRIGNADGRVCRQPPQAQPGTEWRRPLEPEVTALFLTKDR